MDYQLVIRLKMKWQIKELPHYKWSTCKRLVNCKTGKEIKKTINNGSVGYWIGKNFISVSKMKDKIELIPKIKTPFLS